MNWLSKYKNYPETHGEGTDKTDTCPEKFCPEKSLKLFQDTLKQLNKSYIPGAIKWVEINRPELSRHIEETETRIDTFYKAQDMAGYKEAVKEFKQLLLLVIEEGERR